MITVDTRTTGIASAAAAVSALPPAGPSAVVGGVDRGVPASLRQAIASACGAVPGLAAVAVTRRPRLQAPTGGPQPPDDLEVSADGWSPSFHWLSMQWRIPLRGHDPESPEGTAIAFDAVRAHVAIQRRRATDALAIGIAAPIIPAGDDTPIGHLTADRSSLALAALAHGGAARGILARAVADIHNAALDEPGGPRLVGKDAFVIDELGTQHLGWLTTIEHGGTTPPANMTDDILTLHSQRIPETLIAALAGRRVDTLAAVHPLLDARIIGEAEQLDGNDPIVVLRLVPDRVRLGTLT